MIVIVKTTRKARRKSFNRAVVVGYLMDISLRRNLIRIFHLDRLKLSEWIGYASSEGHIMIVEIKRRISHERQ